MKKLSLKKVGAQASNDPKLSDGGGLRAVADELERAPLARKPAFECSALVSLAARWLEEAKALRENVASEKALGAGPFYGDAEIGYAECLEDKAAELKKWAGSEAN